MTRRRAFYIVRSIAELEARRADSRRTAKQFVEGLVIGLTFAALVGCMVAVNDAVLWPDTVRELPFTEAR